MPPPLGMLENVSRDAVPAKRHRKGFFDASFGNRDGRMGREDERLGVPRESVPFEKGELTASEGGCGNAAGAIGRFKSLENHRDIDRRQ